MYLQILKEELLHSLKYDVQLYCTHLQEKEN